MINHTKKDCMLKLEEVNRGQSLKYNFDLFQETINEIKSCLCVSIFKEVFW
jgi:hypothetical protein